MSDLSSPAPSLASAYDPTEVEERRYAQWLEAKAFRGEPQAGRDPYCIMIPPPNVTGILTMGHVLNNTIQDILIRRARLEGQEAMWLPGTDHASIATHARIEKRLKERGSTRRELGREKFLEEAWSWSHEHRDIILKQLRKLGASADWERTVFTMDPDYEKAVLHAFVELFRRGYIYRGVRMVNWCPATRTALSDEEVIMKSQRGLFYRMRYEIVERPGEYVEIATTRPETIMGDTAVAFHPDDPRYQHLKGLHAWRPFPREKIPFVEDRAIDIEFGSGMLKVTPAHDRVDYEIGLRHNLPVIDVLNPDGTLNELAGEEFAGMDRFKARKVAAAKLKELGLLVKEEPYENNVGFSERADVPIEPRLTEQWWMRYPKAAEARQAVADGHIQFFPQNWEKTYLHWMDNLQDWCISRQLWWGQRIPVWYRKGLDPAAADLNDPAQVHVSAEGPSDPENWVQDEDVLDTWASSWLWPFATLGWPEETSDDLKYFYPTSTLVTGPDIIFFWVARMIMAGLEFMGNGREYEDPEAKAKVGQPLPAKPLSKEELKARIPFRHVYFTGIIRDEKGRKMSKSLGNSPDPLDLIAEFGADGLRFGIMSMAPKGQDILFSRERVAIGRNFCNKLWNASRFRLMNEPAGASPGRRKSLEAILARIDARQLDDADRWMLNRTVETLASVEGAFETYEFNQITQGIYALFWADFCDWYVEMAKARLEGVAGETVRAVQDVVIRCVLQLLEPICPHIAEELWEVFAFGQGLMQETPLVTATALREAINKAGIELSPEASARMNALQEFVSAARALKANYNVGAKRDVRLMLVPSEEGGPLATAFDGTLLRLIGAAVIEQVKEQPEAAPASVTPWGTLALDLASAVDVAAESKRLGKERERLTKAIAGSEAKLSNEKFLAKAPENVVAGVRETLAELRAKAEEIDRLLASLGTGS